MENAKITGNKHLGGQWMELYYDGFRVAEANKISVKVTVNREEVQIGLDVDTKVTEVKGEGTISQVKTYTRWENVRQAIMRGEDPRGVMIAKLKDPNAEGGQTERWQLSNVALSEFGFEWESGAVVKQETPFTFTPTDMLNLDAIKPQ